MNLYSFSVLCFSFGVSLIAILALVKRRDAVAFRFFIFSISISGWGYFFSIWASQQFSLETALIIARISYSFVMFIPVTWIYFVFEFIRKREPFKGFYFANYLLALIFTTLCPTPLMIKEMTPFLDFKYMPYGGVAHHFHVAHFFGLVSYGLYFLLKKYLTSQGQERAQLKYFVWGAMVGFIAGGSIYITYYRIPLPFYHLALLPLYPIFTGIALIRYGLFDVQQIADAFQREKITTLGVMAASLNHEMRNPLYIAKGKIEVYQDGVERSCYPNSGEKERKADEVIQSVAAQLNRTLDIMQRFSDFARPNVMFKKENVIFEDVFKEALDLVGHEIKSKNISIKTDFEKELRLTVHRRQFEEILVNLMINACHAMEQKGGELSVCARQFNDKIVIEIADTGPGINEDNLRRIYDPFFTTKGNSGSGLGLYITKQLVEKNDGKISVKSKIGKGTNFSLEFRAK